MTYRQNLKAILDTYLTEIRDDIKEGIIDSIIQLEIEYNYKCCPVNTEKKPEKLILNVRKDKSDLVHYIITGVVDYSFKTNENEEAILWYKTKDNHVDAIVVTHMCYFEEVW